MMASRYKSPQATNVGEEGAEAEKDAAAAGARLSQAPRRYERSERTEVLRKGKPRQDGANIETGLQHLL